jgi:hypothetical protein
MEARSLCQRDHTKLVVLVLTNSEGLPENHTLLRSAAKHGYVLTFMFLNRTDPVEMESPYNAKLPKAITVLRTEPCANTVFMMIDAFDCFFVRPASDTLRRFYEMRRGVVWSAQAGFSYSQGIESTIFDMKARIPLRDVSRFPLHRVDCALRVPTHRTQCPSSERLHKHRFLKLLVCALEVKLGATAPDQTAAKPMAGAAQSNGQRSEYLLSCHGRC